MREGNSRRRIDNANHSIFAMRTSRTEEPFRVGVVDFNGKCLDGSIRRNLGCVICSDDVAVKAVGAEGATWIVVWALDYVVRTREDCGKRLIR